MVKCTLVSPPLARPFRPVIYWFGKEVLLMQYDIYKMLLSLKEQGWLDSLDLLRLARLDPPDIDSLTTE